MTAKDDKEPLDFLPDSWGPRQTMSLFDVAFTKTGPNQVSFEVPHAYFLILLTPQPGRKLRYASDKWKEFSAPRGTVEVIPENTDFSAQWITHKENIIIGLRGAQMLDLATQEFDVGRLELHPLNVGEQNARCHHLAQALRDELNSSMPVGSLYCESLALSLSLCLLKSFAGPVAVEHIEGYKGGLTLRAQRLVQDYMNEYYGRQIGVAELAQLVGLSYSHFLRAYRQTFGISPSKSLRLIRFAAAEKFLLTTTMSIKEISEKCGFASQSHMTSAMKAARGYTPNEVRRFAGD